MNEVFDWKEYESIAREMTAEGAVLLRNEDQALPIRQGEKVSVFGRIQMEYYSAGAGSGGMVNTPYVVSIPEGLKNCGVSQNEELRAFYEDFVRENPFDKGVGWAMEPFCQKEAVLSDDLVERAAAQSDLALIIIGRLCGEDKDMKAEKGSYYLQDEEEALIAQVTKAFRRCIVLLNTGGIIDMSWVEKYAPQAVMYVWAGGCEGGNGVADVLTGRVCPSGHLPDTIARRLSDYPSSRSFADMQETWYREDIYVGYRYFESAETDAVLYPFGFGLSYTTFDREVLSTEADSENVKIKVKVTNTGSVAGKDVIQVYYCPPAGILGKPRRNLIRFGKTDSLVPGESQEITFLFQVDEMASYDDSGITGNKSCYVLEKGVYRFYAGCNVREIMEAGSLEVTDCVVVSCMEEALAPVRSFDRMVIGENGVSYQPVSTRTIDLKARIEERRPGNDMICQGDLGYKFSDVAAGRVSMEDFLSQLSDEDLICMTRGEGMCSPRVTPGTAGAFGGVTDRLQAFGIPAACCADGPAGIRMDCGVMAFGLPIGTLLASSFNIPLVERLFDYEGRELRLNKIDAILGPGINMHRNPLNGRNFEYFSEDPYLTGAMACAELRGLHRWNVTGTIKHFAANDQETGRHTADSIVSERALREIYLRPFEMCVRQADAKCIMTTYGPINGIWTAGNYDLNTTILRDEWGYKGLVMTDWWVKINEEGEEANTKNTYPMVRAQNDLNMVNGNAAENSNDDNTAWGLAQGRITRGELLRNASNILRVVMKFPCMDKAAGREEIIWEERNRPEEAAGEIQVMPPVIVDSEHETILPIDGISTESGSRVQYRITVPGRGVYKMSFRVKSDLGERSQMNVTIAVNGTIHNAFTVNGTGGNWITKEANINVFVALENYVDIFFGQSGIEVGEISFRKDREMPWR